MSGDSPSWLSGLAGLARQCNLAYLRFRIVLLTPVGDDSLQLTARQGSSLDRLCADINASLRSTRAAEDLPTRFVFHCAQLTANETEQEKQRHIVFCCVFSKAPPRVRTSQALPAQRDGTQLAQRACGAATTILGQKCNASLLICNGGLHGTGGCFPTSFLVNFSRVLGIPSSIPTSTNHCRHATEGWSITCPIHSLPRPCRHTQPSLRLSKLLTLS